MKMKYQFLLLFILKSNQLLVDSQLKYYDSGTSTPDRAVVDAPIGASIKERVPVEEYQPGDAEGTRLQTVGTIQDKQTDSRRKKRLAPKKSEDRSLLLPLQKLLSSMARNMPNSTTTTESNPGTESPKDSGIRWITSLDDLQDLIQKVNGSIKDRKGRSVIDLVMEDTGKGPKKVAEFIIPILLEHLKLNTSPSQVDLQGSRSPRRRRSVESPEPSRGERIGLDGISIHGDGEHKAQPGRDGDLIQANEEVSHKGHKGDKSARVRREIRMLGDDIYGDCSSQPGSDASRKFVRSKRQVTSIQGDGNSSGGDVSAKPSGDISTHGDNLKRSTRVSFIHGDGDSSQAKSRGDVSGRPSGDVFTHGDSADHSRGEVSSIQGVGDHSTQTEKGGFMNGRRSGDVSKFGDSWDRSSRALSPRNRNLHRFYSLQRFRNRATGDVGRPETCNTNCCSCHTEPGENTKICASNKIMYSASCEYYCARRYYLHHGQSVVSVPCKIPPTYIPPNTIQLLGSNAFADCEIKTYCCTQNVPRICGSNKLVYNNPQYFTCIKKYYAAEGAHLEAVQCSSEHSMTPPCENCCPGCPELGTPVCANNRKVYKNLCYFECAFKFIKYSDPRSNFTRVHCNDPAYFPTTPPRPSIPTTPPHLPITTAPPSPPSVSTHDIIQEYHRFDFRVVGKKNMTMNITNQNVENDVYG